MNTYSLESFISFCDDMMIAEEAINISYMVKTSLIKIRHALKQLMMNFYKIGTYYVPKKLFEYINKKLKDTEDYEKWAFEIISNSDGGNSTIKLVADIDKYKDRVTIDESEFVNFRERNYSKLEFRKVQSSDIVKQMKLDDRKASRIELRLEKECNDDEVIAYRYELNIFNLRLRLYSELFKWNSIYNRSSDVVNVKHKGQAVYDKPADY